MSSLGSNPEIVDLTADHAVSNLNHATRMQYASMPRRANDFAPNGGGVEVIAIDDEPRGGYKTDPNSRHSEKARKRKRLVHTPVRSNDVIELCGDGRAGFSFRGPAAFSIPSSDNEEDSPFLQVIRVFPDVDHKYLEKILSENGNNVVVVVSMLADNESYPKAITLKPAPSATPLVSIEGEPKKWTYDFMSMDSFEPQGHYSQQAQVQLLIDFPYLSKVGASAFLAQSRYHYAVAHDRILQLLKGKEGLQEQYTRVQSGMFPPSVIGKELPPKYVIQRARKKSSIYHTSILDGVFVEECKYVQMKLAEWNIQTAKELNRRKQKEVCDREGTGVDCLCCFDSYPIEDMIQCKDEGHLFCSDCLKQQTETLVFGAGNLGVNRKTKTLATELLCFQGDCTSTFSRKCLEKALPYRTLEKYDKVQFEICVQQAGMENMAVCPKCNYQVVLSSPDQRVLECPVETCRYESCVLCGEASHIPLRCEEVEKDKKETTGRLTVEEAISAAKIRHCPKCRKPFIKSDGCNKITCSCGSKICYVCRNLIDGPNPYTHFCQTPHCQHKKCKLCPLYTNDKEDDERAMREAGLQAAEQVREQSKQEINATGRKLDVTIDVDAILKQPSHRT